MANESAFSILALNIQLKHWGHDWHILGIADGVFPRDSETLLENLEKC